MDKLTTSTKVSVKRPWKESESDEDLTSSTDAKKKKRSHLLVPKETSKWTVHDLQKINISFCNTLTTYPEDFLNNFEEVRQLVPTLNEDFIKISDYMKSKFNFDKSFGDIKKMTRMQRLQFMEQLNNIAANLSTDNDDDEKQELLKTIKEESRCMIKIIEVQGARFLIELIDLIGEMFLERILPESRYSSLFKQFCEICNFSGSIGVRKTEQSICHVNVISMPDITYDKPYLVRILPPMNRILSIAEVKRSDCIGPVQTEKRSTRSSDCNTSDKGDVLTLVPENIRGLSQHGGQLLLALKESVFEDHSLGLILNQTKIMFSCLAVSSEYILHMGTDLKPNDNGVIYMCGPYDFMKANDRHLLFKTFLRLGQTQHTKY